MKTKLTFLGTTIDVERCKNLEKSKIHLFEESCSLLKTNKLNEKGSSFGLSSQKKELESDESPSGSELRIRMNDDKHDQEVILRTVYSKVADVSKRHLRSSNIRLNPGTICSPL